MARAELEQTITLEEALSKPVRRPSTKESALRMLRDLAIGKDDETI